MNFWAMHPALLYGLAMAGGIALSQDAYATLIPTAVILFSLREKRERLILFSTLYFLMFCLVTLTVTFPPEHPQNGIAHIHIEEIKPYETSFRKGLVLSGTLRMFVLHGEEKPIARNIPFTMKTDSSQIPAHQDALLSSTLIHKKILIPDKKKSWRPLPHTWNLAKWRYQNKEAVRSFIKRQIEDESAAAFLGGLATGLYSDSNLKKELSRFGLQHLMAISGFHFALVALFISSLFRLFLSEKPTAICTLFLLSLYCFFLGASPSVLRAFVMAAVYFFSKIVQKTPRPLNSLGAALMITLAIDPLSIMTIGFQFSFLITASLLMFTSPLEEAIAIALPKRTYERLIAMSLTDQHGYLLLAYIRKSLALTAAVQIAAFPLALFWFQTFPLMSLIYNLFFPLLASLSLALLLAGLALTPIPPLANIIHTLNTFLTSWTLNLATSFPPQLDLWFSADGVSAPLLILYFSGAFIWGGVSLLRRQERKQWAYL